MDQAVKDSVQLAADVTLQVVEVADRRIPVIRLQLGEAHVAIFALDVELAVFQPVAAPGLPPSGAVADVRRVAEDSSESDERHTWDASEWSIKFLDRASGLGFTSINFGVEMSRGVRLCAPPLAAEARDRRGNPIPCAVKIPAPFDTVSVELPEEAVDAVEYPITIDFQLRRDVFHIGEIGQVDLLAAIVARLEAGR